MWKKILNVILAALSMAKEQELFNKGHGGTPGPERTSDPRDSTPFRED